MPEPAVQQVVLRRVAGGDWEARVIGGDVPLLLEIQAFSERSPREAVQRLKDGLRELGLTNRLNVSECVLVEEYHRRLGPTPAKDRW